MSQVDEWDDFDSAEKGRLCNAYAKFKMVSLLSLALRMTCCTALTPCTSLTRVHISHLQITDEDLEFKVRDEEVTFEVTFDDVKEFASSVRDGSIQLPPSDTEVVVSKALMKLIEVPQVVHVGSSGNLIVDRSSVAHILAGMSRPTSSDGALHQLVVKKLQVFDAAAVCEGGASLLDLPGNNTLGAMELMHTRAGVEHAGVVFVVLKTNLAGAAGDVDLLQKCGVMKRALMDPNANVVFLFNREIRRSISAEQITSDDEKATQAQLQSSTQDTWKTQLRFEAGKLYRNGELTQKMSDADLDAVVSRTPMRCIYPMLYTSWKFNVEHATANPELAQRVDDHSNMIWCAAYPSAYRTSSDIDSPGLYVRVYANR